MAKMTMYDASINCYNGVLYTYKQFLTKVTFVNGEVDNMVEIDSINHQYGIPTISVNNLNVGFLYDDIEECVYDTLDNCARKIFECTNHLKYYGKTSSDNNNNSNIGGSDSSCD